jgi:hypothetical protein
MFFGLNGLFRSIFIFLDIDMFESVTKDTRELIGSHGIHLFYVFVRPFTLSYVDTDTCWKALLQSSYYFKALNFSDLMYIFLNTWIFFENHDFTRKKDFFNLWTYFLNYDFLDLGNIFLKSMNIYFNKHVNIFSNMINITMNWMKILYISWVCLFSPMNIFNYEHIFIKPVNIVWTRQQKKKI